MARPELRFFEYQDGAQAVPVLSEKFQRLRQQLESARALLGRQLVRDNGQAQRRVCQNLRLVGDL